MAFNYTGTKQQIAKVIAKYGTVVKITRLAGGSTSTPAVFDEEKKSSESVDNIAQFTGLTVGSSVAYITAIQNPPLPGDTLTAANRSYSVSGVEAYKPAAIVIAYKLTLD